MNRKFSIAVRYYRSLPPRLLAAYVLPTFLIFASSGFVTDMMHTPVARAWEAPLVVLSALVPGLIAVLFVLAPMRSWWFLPIAIAAMVAGTWEIDRLWESHAAAWAAAPASVAAVQQRLSLDGRATIVFLLLGFALFVRFIRGEGVRQTRLRIEMDLAREIHASLVPPIVLETAAVEVRGRSTPSSEVGGDLVDAFERGGGVAACVADVVGHGVPAGALMAMIRGAVRSLLPAGETLGAMLGDVNRLLVDLGRPDRFVTLACLRFDGAGGAEYALAGHVPILRVRRDARAVERFENASPPLGVQAGAAFASGRTTAAPGDLFAIFTDGLSEARDGEQRELGIEGIERLLLEHAARPLEEIERAVFAAAELHGKRLDDQTLLLARVR